MLKKSVLILFATVLAVCSWLAWEFITDTPPQFFPLDNPQGEYRLTKMCPSGQGWNDQQYSQDRGYSVEYTGSGIFMSEDQNNSTFFRICVGKSEVELEPFIGKKIKSIKGKFVGSNTQCIAGKCIDIGGPHVVLNIEELVE